MKKVFASLGVLAFLLLLLTKPFEMLEVYSIHAGHVLKDVHTSAPETQRPVAGANHPVLLEIKDASSNNGITFGVRTWLTSLLIVGGITGLLLIQRKIKKRRKTLRM